MAEIAAEQERLQQAMAEFRAMYGELREIDRGVGTAIQHTHRMQGVIDDEDTRSLKEAIRGCNASRKECHSLFEAISVIADDDRSERVEELKRKLRLAFATLKEHYGQLQLHFNSITMAIPRDRLLHHIHAIFRHIEAIGEVFNALLTYILDNDRTSYQPIIERWARVSGKFAEFHMVTISHLAGLQMQAERNDQFKALLDRIKQIMTPEWFEEFSSALHNGSGEDLQLFQQKLEQMKSELHTIADEIIHMSHS